MNLNNTFPEIDVFFRKESFTVEEINELISRLTIKYNKQELRKAKSIFDLKILQYELKEMEPKSIVINSNPFSTSNRIDTKRIKGDFALNEKRISTKTSVKLPIVLKNNFYDTKDIAKVLEWRVKHVQELIKQKTGKNDCEYISLNDYNQCKEVFECRLKALKKQREKEEFEKKYNTGRVKRVTESDPDGVWGIAAKMGGLGKIIYIRSR